MGKDWMKMSIHSSSLFQQEANLEDVLIFVPTTNNKYR